MRWWKLRRGATILEKEQMEERLQVPSPQPSMFVEGFSQEFTHDHLPRFFHWSIYVGKICGDVRLYSPTQCKFIIDCQYYSVEWKTCRFSINQKCRLFERTLIKLQQRGNWDWEYKVAHSQKSFELISCALKKKQALPDFSTFTRTVRVCAMSQIWKKKLPMLAYLFQIAGLDVKLLPN